MTANEFRNAIVALNRISIDEFAETLLAETHTLPQAMKLWSIFNDDPAKFYAHASLTRRNALWGIIQKRLTVGVEND